MRYTVIKKSLFLFLFLIAGVSLIPAKEWKTGFVVTNSNDTLRGLIAYFGEGSNWHTCEYKENDKSEEQQFSPVQIKSFEFDSGLRYIAMDIASGRMKGRNFVRSLVQGVCSLSYLNVDIDSDSTYSVYLIENSENGKVIRISDAQRGFHIYKKRMYLTLKPFFNDNPIMEAELKRSSFTENELIGLFEKYNDIICTEVKCITFTEVKNVPRRFFLSARFAFQLAGIPGIHCGYETILLKDLKFNAGIDLAASMTLLKFSDLLLFNFGLGFSPLSFDDPRYIEQPKFKGAGITNTISLEIHASNKHVSPFVEFGFFQTGVVMRKSRAGNIPASNPPYGNYWGKELKYKKYYGGLLASVGMDIQINKKSAVPIRFSIYQPVYRDKDNYGDIRAGRYQLAVGYTFRIK